MEDPSYGKRVRNLTDFIKGVHPFTHVAVRRGHRYFHHYLVILVEVGHVEIAHYTSGIKAMKRLAIVSVKLEKLWFNDSKSDLLDFESGLFFIVRENYPKDAKEIEAAYNRLKHVNGECEYSASSNNCETFVRWVLTGQGECEQFEKAGKKSRLMVDGLDSLMDYGKRAVHNNLATEVAPAYMSSVTHLTTNSGDKLIEIVASKAAAKSLGISVQTASKVGPSAIAAGVSTGITAAVSAPIEAVFCGLEIHKLKKLKKSKQIDENQFKRQVTKKVSGSASAVATGAGLGFLGAFVGQIVIPIPVLGGMVGGAVGGIIGNVVGRAAGSTVSGQIYDAVTD